MVRDYQNTPGEKPKFDGKTSAEYKATAAKVSGRRRPAIRIVLQSGNGCVKRNRPAVLMKRRPDYS